MNIIFYSETSYNNRYHVMSTFELEYKGAKKVTDSTLHGHKNEVYKNLKEYWVSAAVMAEIKTRQDVKVEKTCF